MSLNSDVASSSKLSEEQLAGFIIGATKEVFGTMVMMEPQDQYPLREPVTTFHCSVTGMVGLAGIYWGSSRSIAPWSSPSRSPRTCSAWRWKRWARM